MPSILKRTLFVVMIFLLGGVIGRYVLPAQSKTASTVLQKAGIPLSINPDNPWKDKTRLKLDLLKEYQNFIYLPKGEIPDPAAYAEGMGNKVETIGDDTLIDMYNATGDTEGKEKKIIDFLNYLTESIKSDLSQ